MLPFKHRISYLHESAIRISYLNVDNCADSLGSIFVSDGSYQLRCVRAVYA